MSSNGYIHSVLWLCCPPIRTREELHTLACSHHHNTVVSVSTSTWMRSQGTRGLGLWHQDDRCECAVFYLATCCCGKADDLNGLWDIGILLKPALSLHLPLRKHAKGHRKWGTVPSSQQWHLVDQLLPFLVHKASDDQVCYLLNKKENGN